MDLTPNLYYNYGMNSEILKFKRLLRIDFSENNAIFLWGARKTGKSTYLKQAYPQAVTYDLLLSNEFIRLMKEPSLLREEVLALCKQHEEGSPLVIIDEVQKVPMLLDEVHWLLENTQAEFILCGSSARKLKKEGANLLGGRAWRYTFYPLVSAEMGEFNLVKVLNQGLIPQHYLSKNHARYLAAYVEDYLEQEIKAEGLVRNLQAFSRFLEALAWSHGQMVNYTNIARDCGVTSKTVAEYFQILEDTLLGYFVRPYVKRSNRQLITQTPKFYLFDVGVANYLANKTIIEAKGLQAGESFEHFILMELMAYRGLNHLRFTIQYWRTNTGFEVDFVLGDAQLAIEVKISTSPRAADLKGLLAFCKDYSPPRAIVVCQAERARLLEWKGIEVEILPYREFLTELWKGRLI